VSKSWNPIPLFLTYSSFYDGNAIPIVLHKFHCLSKLFRDTWVGCSAAPARRAAHAAARALQNLSPIVLRLISNIENISGNQGRTSAQLPRYGYDHIISFVVVECIVLNEALSQSAARCVSIPVLHGPFPNER
jgi:hypothetical protein